LAQSYKDKAVFVKIDGDQHKTMVTNLGLTSYPTFQFYLQEKKVDEFRGADENKLRTIVAKYCEEKEAQEPKSPFNHFPLKQEETVVFKSIKYDAVLKKAKDCSSEIGKDSKFDSKLSLSSSELKALDTMISHLEDTKTYQTKEFSEIHFTVIDKMLSWPDHMQMPVLHLIRMLFLHPHAASTYAKKKEDILKSLLTIVRTTEKPIHAMLAMRAVANMFNRRILSRFISERAEDVFDCIQGTLEKIKDEDFHTACISVHINFAILFREDSKAYEQAKIMALSGVTGSLDSATNPKLLYRLLVVLGTLIYRDENSLTIAQGLEASALVDRLAKSNSTDDNIVQVAKELTTALSVTPTSK